jgi:hypothetical protein
MGWPSLGKHALFASAFFALAGIGVAGGVLSGRWAAPDQPIHAALDRIPLTIGDWKGSTPESTADLLPAAEPGTVLLRRYVNGVNGSVVTLFLTVGRPGPVAESHTPDRCYAGAGYACNGSILRQTISGEEGRRHEFQVATFSKNERAAPVHVRVFWAWTATGTWQAPEYPRLKFAGERRLFKMYVIRQLLKEGEPLDADPVVPFVQALAPELETVVRADD